MAVIKLKVPELFPQPKELYKTEGESDLSADVRLVTSNVPPLQRKAIRSILSDAGVRVVANKKKYVVDASVKPVVDFDLTRVPEDCRNEYYELEIRGSEVFIRAPYHDGTVWGAHTAAVLFKRFIAGVKLPNLIVKDWPLTARRGIFIENKWGPDRMTFADWCNTIDQLSQLKLNTLGIGLYGCWGSCRFEAPDKPTEFLMMPVPENDGVKTVHHLKWFSPEKDVWLTEDYLPAMRENEELLAEVISYAAQKGITVVPYFNSFGHNTFFAREIPEISAKNEDGTPTGVGYCITSPKTREFVEKMYGAILEKYYPDGAEYFHVQMDEVWPDLPWPNEPLKAGAPWCKCAECKKHTNEENLLEYVFWLVKMLVDKGVKKVVIWNDQLTRHMNAFDANFAKRLEDAGLKDKLILDWWWYSNSGLNEQTRVSIGKKLGISGWVSPMTCYYNWSTYDYRRPNIDLMMHMCEDEGGSGVVSYAVHDPSHLDHEALLALYAWESTKGLDIDTVQKRWAETRFGADADLYIQAVDKIREAVSTPNYATCLNYGYTYTRETLTAFPRPYPGDALDALEAADGASEALLKASATAAEADALLQRLVAHEGLAPQDVDCVNSLRGEAARIRGLSDAFGFLLSLRAELKDGMVLKRMATSVQKARDAFVEQMAIVEQCKPSWVAPACLHALSALLAFFDQLILELKKHAARKQAKLIDWTVVTPQSIK